MPEGDCYEANGHLARAEREPCPFCRRPQHSGECDPGSIEEETQRVVSEARPGDARDGL